MSGAASGGAGAPLTLLRNAEVLAPDPLGRRDILMGGGRILAIAAPGEIAIGGTTVETIDARGRVVAPGFIDNHVHVLGGGGGLGFASRAPELQSSQLVRRGITSVIGMLGFDATTKSMAALVAKTKAFREEGLSAYCLTGATLEHPVPTLTGMIRTDIAFVDEIIGVGELSISELGYGFDSFGTGAQYVAEAAVAGLLAGRLARKAGYCCLQVPPYRKTVLKPMFDVVERTGIPIRQFIPSHVNQTDEYMADAVRWGRQGGWVDVGANYSPDNNYARATRPAEAVKKLLDAGVPLSNILLSSDGNGAPPKEEKGEAKPRVANYMPLGALGSVVAELVVSKALSASDALSIVTSNVAKATGLDAKGAVVAGGDADLVVLDEHWVVADVFCGGVRKMAEGRVLARGMFDAVIADEIGQPAAK